MTYPTTNQVHYAVDYMGPHETHPKVLCGRLLVDPDECYVIVYKYKEKLDHTVSCKECLELEPIWALANG